MSQGYSCTSLSASRNPGTVDQPSKNKHNISGTSTKFVTAQCINYSRISICSNKKW